MKRLRYKGRLARNPFRKGSRQRIIWWHDFRTHFRVVLFGRWVFDNKEQQT